MTSEGDLESKIKQQKKAGTLFSRADYTKWVAQLLCGLFHIHQQSIIHRDIKSQNVFLKDGGNIVIGDFGVSKKDVLAATFIGSPYYVSPEMLGDKKYSQKTDIWSLGVLFYEILSLQYPFISNSDNEFAIYNKILKGGYPELPTAIDPSIKNIVRAMLVVDPQQRASLPSLLGTN